MPAGAMVSRTAIAGMATPAGTIARRCRTGRQLGAGSPSPGVFVSARAGSCRAAAAGALAARSVATAVRDKARVAEVECRVARRRSSPSRPDIRDRLLGCFARDCALAGGRADAVKLLPTARRAAGGSRSAFSSDSEARSSSSSSDCGGGGGGGDGVTAVVDDGAQKYLVATSEMGPGDVVFSRVGGPLVGEATRHSVQVGEGLHLEAENDLKFFNHACEPNCQLEVVMEATAATGGQAQARRPYLRVKVRAPRVDENEPLTIDYNAMELELSSPFDCSCGADRCRGRVSGFANLPPAVQREYLDGSSTARSTVPTSGPTVAAAVDGGGGADGAVAEGSGRTSTGPPPLTDVVKKWAEENITVV